MEKSKRRSAEGGQAVQLNLPPSALRVLNNSKLEEVYQWVAYYASRDVKVEYIVDATAELPLLGLQLLKVSPSSKLTLTVNTEEGEKVGGLLDFVTGIAERNNINVQNISCVTGPPDPSGEKYNLLLVSPVQQCGRLDQNLLRSLPGLLAALVPASGLILPHKLQLWCQVVESEELSSISHLRSNHPVGGFKIADQINILAVTHLQELNISTLKKKDLTAPVHVRDIDLTQPNLEREFLDKKTKVTHSGTATSVVYWFLVDFGWGVQFSTLQGDTYSQGAVMCTETPVTEEEEITVICQMENGLLNFFLK